MANSYDIQHALLGETAAKWEGTKGGLTGTVLNTGEVLVNCVTRYDGARGWSSVADLRAASTFLADLADAAEALIAHNEDRNVAE